MITHSINAVSFVGPKDTQVKTSNYDKRIAFVEPTFTYAAYRYGSFYNFYHKYTPLLGDKPNLTITADINLLKDRPIPHGPFPYYSHPTRLDIPYKSYFNMLFQHIKKNNIPVTNLTDVDVHNGKIFQTDGRNAYDILFLFHNEYVTTAEYNNLRQFVSNGGTIVFTEANILYAEISYNKNLDSITLVNGHNWKFNGKIAKNSVAERWLNENKEWMGSNFLDIPSNDNIKFKNDPFNYTHTEEQYVTNPNAKILIDYHVYNLPSSYSKIYPNPTVATYEMDYGKGKIINLGIWGHTLINNKVFLNYFENTLIPLALSPPIHSLPIFQTVFSTPSNKINKYISNLNVSSNKTLIGIVNYPLPFAIKNNTGNFIPNCNPPSGAIFSIGDTLIKCTAIDKSRNNTAITSFILRVLDRNGSR